MHNFKSFCDNRATDSTEKSQLRMTLRNRQRGAAAAATGPAAARRHTAAHNWHLTEHLEATEDSYRNVINSAKDGQQLQGAGQVCVEDVYIYCAHCPCRVSKHTK